MSARRWLLAGLLATALAGCRLTIGFPDHPGHLLLWTRPSWSRDPAWYDGQAEKCVYEATRTIYGKERRYLATAYTNKERVDAATTCKTDDPNGLEVFKHHWSEIVPTERYDYRFSTMTYHRVEHAEPFKLTVSTQEDCGASFKECWPESNRFRWSDSVYFPGAGRREGEIERTDVFAFADGLALALRYLPANEPSAPQRLALVPAQRDTHHVSWDLVSRSVRCTGRTTLELPIGRIEADGYELSNDAGLVLERFWFAADERPPVLRAMVRYEGQDGVTYALKSIERTAYWKH